MRASRTQRSQETYEEYVEKYVNHPKTKDDTFTPPAVYDCVKKWVLENYPQFTERDLIRPFWPGADYTRCDYPEGCLVLDNPPWSITTPICRWFTEHRINYFLFANHTTHFSAWNSPRQICKCGIFSKLDERPISRCGQWISHLRGGQYYPMPKRR